MKPLKELCIPRDSVFDVARRDTVLNLTHLTTDKIDAKDFSEEIRYTTNGSDPKLDGGSYDNPVLITRDSWTELNLS